jgi:integrase
MGVKNKLTAKGIAALEPGKYGDGAGLMFVKREDGGAQWVLRLTIHGRRREMGLGAYPDVSLAEARREADAARSKVRAGTDPIRAREVQRSEAKRNLHFFKDIVQDAFESRKSQLKGDGLAGRWLSPLELHVLPKLGKVPVAEINQIDIRDTLSPIWHTKADTARKALNRIGVCLTHAAALGLPVDLQATDKAKALLGKARHKVEHIPAMPWQEVPAFYASLNEGTLANLALRLLILTGVRSGPIRHIHESQIEGDIWTIPGEGMKGRKDASPDFRVPLSPEAMAVIEEARAFSRNGFLFPSAGKKLDVISDATMSGLMKRREVGAKPHGFRTSIRLWLEERTDAPHQVAEAVLAHFTSVESVKAYLRTDYLEQRRPLMNRWGQFVSGKSSGEIVQLVAAK